MDKKQTGAGIVVIIILLTLILVTNTISMYMLHTIYLDRTYQSPIYYPVYHPEPTEPIQRIDSTELEKYFPKTLNGQVEYSFKEFELAYQIGLPGVEGLRKATYRAGNMFDQFQILIVKCTSPQACLAEEVRAHSSKAAMTKLKIDGKEITRSHISHSSTTTYMWTDDEYFYEIQLDHTNDEEVFKDAFRQLSN